MQVLVSICNLAILSVAVGELQFLGFGPSEGGRVTINLGGVTEADYNGFDAQFQLTWPTSPRSGRFQALEGTGTSPPASGFLNASAMIVPKSPDWDGPYALKVESVCWIDGWATLRKANCTGDCTYVY